MKLIKTKLLIKHNHDSDVGIATASHLDFCKYKVRCLKEFDCIWSFKGYRQVIFMFVFSTFALLVLPILMITNGLIYYPYWIVLHIIGVKRIIKEFGADRINSEAEKLVKEYSKDKE